MIELPGVELGIKLVICLLPLIQDWRVTQTLCARIEKEEQEQRTIEMLTRSVLWLLFLWFAVFPYFKYSL